MHSSYGITLSLFPIEITAYQYSIMIPVSGVVEEDVTEFNRFFGQEFGVADKLRSPGHISLCGFLLKGEHEPLLQRRLIELLNNIAPFLVSVNGFGKFDSSGVLFLQPEKEQVMQFQNELRNVLRSEVRVGAKYTPKLRDPHITIAVSDNQDQFETAWSYFKNSQYESSFVVSGIEVIKREVNQENGYLGSWTPCFGIPLLGSRN